MHINTILPGSNVDDILAEAILQLKISLLLWLAAMSLITFFVFGLDKWKAKRCENHPSTRRIPEKTLFLLAGLGGSLGALLGMRVWHHKTLHKSFRLGIPIIFSIQLALTAFLLTC